MMSKFRTLILLSKSEEIAPPQATPTCNPIEPARADRWSTVFLKSLKKGSFWRSFWRSWGRWGDPWLHLERFWRVLGAVIDILDF